MDLDLGGVSGFFVGGIVEEGADRGQPEVATAGRDPAPVFQVIQEGRDQGGIDRRER